MRRKRGEERRIRRRGERRGWHKILFLQVGVNGIISFDREFSLNSPENFPSTDGKVFYSYLVAPYWSDIDTRREGRVRYESYYLGDSIASDRQLNTVNDFIQTEEDSDFQGNWMMLASWEDVHPFPHGDIANFDRVDPYLELVSIHLTSYIRFSTRCDLLKEKVHFRVSIVFMGDSDKYP